MPHPLHIKHLGRSDYEATWRAMQAYTAQRDAVTPDALWLTEHAPVYTLGLNRREVNPPLRSDIPLVLVDRGGKITYHGPGQTVVYVLIDLKRRGWNIRQLVSAMEDAVIALLAQQDISAHARADAPGVYVGEAKIASLGLRLKNGCSYHGLALNVDMDLAPFDAIDPCGYRGLQVTQLSKLGVAINAADAGRALVQQLTARLNYAQATEDIYA